MLATGRTNDVGLNPSIFNGEIKQPAIMACGNDIRRFRLIDLSTYGCRLINQYTIMKAECLLIGESCKLRELFNIYRYDFRW